MRPDWTEWGLAGARWASMRGDCRRRQVGAVLFRPDHTLASTGYNGHAPGGRSCLKGECPRGMVSTEFLPPESSYDNTEPEFRCESQHAELNCLLFAREDVTGYTLYVTDKPCGGCWRAIRAARLARVVWGNENGYEEATL